MTEDDDILEGFGEPPELSSEQLQNMLGAAKDKAARDEARKRKATTAALVLLLLIGALTGGSKIWNGQTASSDHKKKNTTTTTAHKKVHRTTLTFQPGVTVTTQVSATPSTDQNPTTTTKAAPTVATSQPSATTTTNPSTFWVTGLATNQYVSGPMRVQAFTNGINADKVEFIIDNNAPTIADTNGAPWCMFGDSNGVCNAGSLASTQGGNTHVLTVYAYVGPTIVASVWIRYTN